MDSISTAASFIADADAVLVVAGAGMSVGPNVENYGRSFVDNAAFRHFYPKLTFARNSWEASFSPAQPSGWWIDHTHMMTGGSSPSPAYALLLDLLDTKDYFVLTSNVDGLFSRTGFDPDRIYTPQGDFRVRQCSVPCSNMATWLGRSSVDMLLPQIDTHTMDLQGSVPDSWTVCQRCGQASQRPNLRGGDFFVHTPYQPQQDKLVAFVERAIREKRKMVVLEIGCGFNTPVVTRMPAESIARETGAPFVRINLTDCDMPNLPAAMCLPMDTTGALQLLVAEQTRGASKAVLWPQLSQPDGGQWRQMLRRLRDPVRPEKFPPLQSWPRTPLSAITIALDGRETQKTSFRLASAEQEVDFEE